MSCAVLRILAGFRESCVDTREVYLFLGGFSAVKTVVCWAKRFHTPSGRGDGQCFYPPGWLAGECWATLLSPGIGGGRGEAGGWREK